MRESAYSLAVRTLGYWAQPIVLSPTTRQRLVKDMRKVMKAVEVQAQQIERVKASRAKLALEWGRENRKLETALRNLSGAYASTKGKRQ